MTYLRKPIIAKLSPYKGSDKIHSCFAGEFWQHPDDEWPSINDEALSPILQISVKDLPNCPDALKPYVLVQVFFAESLPVGSPVKNGDGWFIRTYKSAESLEPFDTSGYWFDVNSCWVRWLEGDEERPVYDDGNAPAERGDDGVFPSSGTKIGGWPSYCQGSPDIQTDLVIQIGSEEKADFMIGDNGCAYIYKNGEDWLLHWDCY